MNYYVQTGFAFELILLLKKQIGQTSGLSRNQSQSTSMRGERVYTCSTMLLGYSRTKCQCLSADKNSASQPRKTMGNFVIDRSADDW